MEPKAHPPSGSLPVSNAFVLDVVVLSLAFLVFDAVAAGFVGTPALEDEHRLEAETSTALDLTATIDHDRLPAWWATHVENDEVTEFRVEFDADVALPTGTVTVSLGELEHVETVETDVWGEKRA